MVKKCYFIKTGKVRIYRENEGGKEFTTKIISEGECFSVEAMLSLSSYGDSAIALTDLVLQYVDKEVFLEKVYSALSHRKFSEGLVRCYFRKRATID